MLESKFCCEMLLEKKERTDNDVEGHAKQLALKKRRQLSAILRFWQPVGVFKGIFKKMGCNRQKVQASMHLLS